MTSLGTLGRPGSRKDRPCPGSGGGAGQQGEQAPSLGMVWEVEAGYQSLLRRLIRSHRGRWLLMGQQPRSPLPPPAVQAGRMQSSACAPCLRQLPAPTAGVPGLGGDSSTG